MQRVESELRFHATVTQLNLLIFPFFVDNRFRVYANL